MISIIICSIDAEQLQAVSKNIQSTIGVPFEIISIHNRNTNKGISQVYNEGALLAKYELLCFIHEDIVIKTQDWGIVLLRIFKDPKMGLVGLAGSTYRPLTPAPWGGFPGETSYYNIIQGFKYKSRDDLLIQENHNNELLTPVTCVDGVWLCTTRSIITTIKFDEETFKNFHCYDIDISLSIGKKFIVAVTYEILIKHLSEGQYDASWVADNLKLFYKWNTILPYSIQPNLTKKQIYEGEKRFFKEFIEKMIRFNFSMRDVFDVLWTNSRFFKLSPRLFFKLNYYVLKKFNEQQQLS